MFCDIRERWPGETTRLTPIQREIERQRQRLGSLEVEDRRDALMRLANLKRPEASRAAAAAALNDASPTVRVAACHAVISLPTSEAATLLIPLLKDKDEFVRREVAFALGRDAHPSAMSALVELLHRDKKPSVRAAAAVAALGEIGDDSAVPALAQCLSEISSKKQKSRSDRRRIRRQVSRCDRSGQIGSRAAVPASDRRAHRTNRTRSTRAAKPPPRSGSIGDASAMPALKPLSSQR